jgi:hypothetical protein
MLKMFYGQVCCIFYFTDEQDSHGRDMYTTTLIKEGTCILHLAWEFKNVQVTVTHNRKEKLAVK